MTLSKIVSFTAALSLAVALSSAASAAQLRDQTDPRLHPGRRNWWESNIPSAICTVRTAVSITSLAMQPSWPIARLSAGCSPQSSLGVARHAFPQHEW